MEHICGWLDTVSRRSLAAFSYRSVEVTQYINLKLLKLLKSPDITLIGN